MTRSSEIKKARISEKLTYYLQQINNTFGHAKELIGEAYRIATEEENYTPEEAKKLLLDNITIFSKRTIYLSLPSECKDMTQQQRRLNKRKPVAILQQPILQDTKDSENLYEIAGTEGAAHIHAVESKLGQKQNTVEPHRGQITHFKLSGDMMDEFLSYISMIGKDDYFLFWIYDGELIDWEISPVLEGRMQTTDNPGKIRRRKKRLDLEKTYLDNASPLKSQYKNNINGTHDTK